MNTVTQKTEYRYFFLIGSAAALFQLIILLAGLIITAGAGSIPETAEEFYTFMNNSPIMGFLIDDFFSVILITMYLFICPPLFLVLKEKHFTLAFYGAFLSIIAVILTLSVHTGFSLLDLSSKYIEAADSTARQSVLAAGEALIAGNIWNSTAGFFSGILLQGGGLMLTFAMRGTNRFRRITIISGLLANGLDLVNHLIAHWLPSAAKILLFTCGPFYLIWYFMIFIDLKAVYHTLQD